MVSAVPDLNLKDYFVDERTSGVDRLRQTIRVVAFRIFTYIKHGIWINETTLGRELNSNASYREKITNTHGATFVSKAIELASLQTMSDYLLFAKIFFKSVAGVSFPLPCSEKVSIAMCEHVQGNTAVLEVGAGIGNMTEVIFRKSPMRFVVSEIEEMYLQTLQQRFADKPNTEYIGDFLGIDESQKFDHIVCSVPLGTLSKDLLEQFFAKFDALMNEGGTLSFVELVGNNVTAKLSQERGECYQLKQDYVQQHQGTVERIYSWNFWPVNLYTLNFCAC